MNSFEFYSGEIGKSIISETQIIISDIYPHMYCWWNTYYWSYTYITGYTHIIEIIVSSKIRSVSLNLIYSNINILGAIYRVKLVTTLTARYMNVTTKSLSLTTLNSKVNSLSLSVTSFFKILTINIVEHPSSAKNTLRIACEKRKISRNLLDQ